MAIIFLPRKRIQKHLVLVFIMIVLVMFLVVWYGFFRKPKPALPPVIYKPPKIEINLEVLRSPFLRESKLFEEIKPFEEIKLPEEEIGRENPFLPY